MFSFGPPMKHTWHELLLTAVLAALFMILIEMVQYVEALFGK